MDFFDLHRTDRTFSGFLQRIQALRKLNPLKKWIPQHISANKADSGWFHRNWHRIQPSVFGLSFIAACAISAWAAQDLVHSEALRELELRRIPSRNTWHYSLLSRGFQVSVASENLKRAYRSLPSTQDNPGSVWLSSDRNWIATFQGPSENESSAPDLYCHHCELPPSAWEPSGVGWSGFDAVLAKIFTTAESVNHSRQRKTTDQTHLRDPRAISY